MNYCVQHCNDAVINADVLLLSAAVTPGVDGLTPRETLHRDLFSDYMKNVLPATDLDSPVVVNIAFSLMSLRRIVSERICTQSADTGGSASNAAVPACWTSAVICYHQKHILLRNNATLGGFKVFRRTFCATSRAVSNLFMLILRLILSERVDSVWSFAQCFRMSVRRP